MKKIFISLIFILNLSHAFAQGNSIIQEIEETPDWPTMLSNLDTSQINSGVLIDKVTSFSNLLNYNVSGNNAADAKLFNQALSELYHASDETRFINENEQKNRTRSTISNNSVDIGIINTTFQKLNFNEENQSLSGVIFNQASRRYEAVAGRESFISKKISIIAPLKEFISGSSFIFNFKNDLIFNNATTTIKTLVVDFGDGNTASTIISENIIVSPSKVINYTSSGAKTLKFTITYSDDSRLNTYGYLYVDYRPNTKSSLIKFQNTGCIDPSINKGIFTSKLPFKGYTENSAVFGKIEYTIFYSNGNNTNQIKKPIIIVDGFDPKDKRKVRDCDCENDTTPAPNNCFLKNSTITFDWKRGGFPFIKLVFDPLKHRSISDLMEYKVGGSPVNLIVELRKIGYDVIIVNNPTYTSTNEAGEIVAIDGGADYIERNAMTLVSYIQEIKEKQNNAGSTEQLVLIGPSMGGQITRYALAYMEKKFEETNDEKWQHNARLWVSVDSPHLGANIPIGAQANIWFFADRLGKEAAQKQYYEELNSIAGKQQIIHQFEDARNVGYLGESSFFKKYYNDLNSNGVAGSGGYPVTTSTFRKIAIVNGSLTGKKEALENQSFLYMRAYAQGFFPFQNSTVTFMRIHDSFMPAAYQTGNVFEGDGQNSKAEIVDWQLYVDFTHPRYSLSVNNQDFRGSLDVVPGGYFNTGKQIRDEISKELSNSGVRQETRDYIENHSFIPSFSALGHLYPNQNWGNPLNVDLTCPSNKQTPFDSYYGTAENTEHVSFTEDSVKWLMKELGGDPQPPSFPADSNSLYGPPLVCNGTNTVYSFLDLCNIPGVPKWTVSPNLQIVNSTEYNIEVKSLTDGEASITATFKDNKEVIKKIWIGAPPTPLLTNSSGVPYDSTNLPDGCGNYDNPYWTFKSFNTLDNATQFKFSLLNGRDYYKTVNDGFATISAQELGMIGGQTATVTVKSINDCGETRGKNFGFKLYKPTSCECGFGNNCNLARISNITKNKIYSVFPVPTSDIINISLYDQNEKPISDTRIVAKLYNMIGEQKSNVEIANNTASINVSNLPKGIYVLKIDIDGNIENHQVVVE
jgi:hypothetical protein